MAIGDLHTVVLQQGQSLSTINGNSLLIEAVVGEDCLLEGPGIRYWILGRNKGLGGLISRHFIPTTGGLILTNLAINGVPALVTVEERPFIDPDYTHTGIPGVLTTTGDPLTATARYRVLDGEDANGKYIGANFVLEIGDSLEGFQNINGQSRVPYTLKRL